MADKGKIRVSVTITIEVDRDAYDETFSESASAADVREYVKSAAVSAVASEFGEGDGFAVVADWR